MRYIFTIPVEDVQYLAKKKFGRKLSIDELGQVKKGVEFGLECWEDVVKYAMDDLEIN
jgi:hypothetical protein